MNERVKLPSLSLLTWALNEQDNVEIFLQRAVAFCREISHDFEIIFIDDGSTDMTLFLTSMHLKNIPQLHIYQHHKNLGVGESMKTAISKVKKEFFIWQTLDWSYDFQNIVENIHYSLEGYILHGVRTQTLNEAVKSIAKRSDSRLKGLISLLNFVLIKLLFQLPFNDFQNVTLYPFEVAKSQKISSTSSFASPELLLKCFNLGHNFLEIPVTFIPRKAGEAKGTKFPRLVESFIEIIKFRLHYRSPHHPGSVVSLSDL